MVNPVPYQSLIETAAEQRERLIIDHLPQVRWIATRIHERLPASFSLEDLISTGIVGLISAVDNFDPRQNVKLATYAEYKIRGAILDSIRGLDGVAPHKRKKLKQIERTIAALEQRLQRVPAEEEIAKELDIGLAEYREWLLDTRAVFMSSLDASPENGEGVTFLNLVPDSDENLPTRLLERSELERLVTDGINRMPPVERMILNLYYKDEQNLSEIAAVLNVHITRVSQLKNQAILRLRSHLEKQWPRKRGIF